MPVLRELETSLERRYGDFLSPVILFMNETEPALENFVCSAGNLFLFKVDKYQYQ